MTKRKLRTREHVIEDLSENYLERMVLNAGHVLRRPQRDYGVDVSMFHFSDSGELENGEVRFQLKATDNLKVISNGRFATVRIKTSDIRYWSMEFYPFILILLDVQRQLAHWIGINDLLDQDLDLEQLTETIRIPVHNVLSGETIELFRQQSLSLIDRLGANNDE